MVNEMNYTETLKKIVEWNIAAEVQKTELQKKTQLNMLLDEINEFNDSTDEENEVKELCDILFVAVGYFHVSDCDNLAETLHPMNVEHSFNQLMDKAMHQDMYVITIASKALQMLIESDNIKVLETVVENNFSKFCQSRYELNMTIDKYQKIGVACNYRTTKNGYVVYSAVDQMVGGKFFQHGKILKNASYKDCVLTDFNVI